MPAKPTIDNLLIEKRADVAVRLKATDIAITEGERVTLDELFLSFTPAETNEDGV